MNQFQMNRHYLMFWIFAFILMQPTTAQIDDTLSNSTLTNDTNTATSQASSQGPFNNNKPANDPIDDTYNFQQAQIFNPTPSSYPPSIFLPSVSDKLFELSFKKKFFPFGKLSLDITKYKNQPILLQQQQYLKPLVTAPQLVVPYQEPISEFFTQKPSSNYFNNIFNHNFDWGAIVTIPGIAIQKFGNFGVNIFSKSSLKQNHKGHAAGISHTNQLSNIQSNGNGGLITGQMPFSGLLDERIKSKKG